MAIRGLTSEKSGTRYLLDDEDLKTEEGRAVWRKILSEEPEEKTSKDAERSPNPPRNNIVCRGSWDGITSS
jgi:hypothetical protein